MKPKVLVDMDGVLADVYSQYIALEYKDTGVKPVLEVSAFFSLLSFANH